MHGYFYTYDDAHLRPPLLPGQQACSLVRTLKTGEDVIAAGADQVAAKERCPVFIVIADVESKECLPPAMAVPGIDPSPGGVSAR